MNRNVLLWITIVTFVTELLSCSRSINAYRDGSVWFCEGSTDEWPPTYYRETYYFKGDTVISQKKYLKLYQTYTSKDERYVCGVRTENNKVFFVPKDRKWELLIFDYDMKPGDIVEIYSTCRGYYEDEYPTPDTIKCLGKSTIKSCGNTYEVFTVAVPPAYWAPGKWIKGIGSDDGPISNTYMQCAGGGSSPYQLVVDGKIVWIDSVYAERMNKIF